jgi:PIN domain
MRVFIDANIYLGFIRPADEKLEALAIFRKNVKKEKINLLFPQITRDEFFRNIQQEKTGYGKSIEKIKVYKPPLPAIVQKKDIRKQIDAKHAEYSELLEQFKDSYYDAVENMIKTEIKYLIDNSVNIHEDQSIINLAQTRRIKGNPPGKGGNTPLGDEIAWELILNKCFDDDITIITGDNDWVDPQRDGTPKIKDFLTREWTAKTTKHLQYYNTLSEYVKDTIEGSEIDQKDINAEKEVVAAPVNGGFGPATFGSVGFGMPFSTASLSPSAINGPARFTIDNPAPQSSAASLATIGIDYGAGKFCLKCGQRYNAGSTHLCVGGVAVGP